MRIPGGRLPEEFMPTVNSQFDPYQRLPRRPHQQGNPQTDILLKRLGLAHTGVTIPYQVGPSATEHTLNDMDIHLSQTNNQAKLADSNEIDLDD